VAYHNHLYQNVPNPFNPSTTVRYELRGPGIVSLVVYDVAGRMVKRLVDENKPGGVHTVTWDGTSESGSRVSSGIYFYKLETINYVQTRKIVLLK
jgi:flagellar hook assembly protein FlgD